MSLDKAIKSGKEWRKPYRKSAAFDPACQRHGPNSCPVCQDNRQHANRKRIEAAKESEDELMKLEPAPMTEERRSDCNQALRLIGIDVDLY